MSEQNDAPLERKQHAPVEHRTATIAGVNFAQRVIEVIAVPYDQTAVVEYRGRMLEESFAPGSFDGIEKRPNRVKVNRDHDVRRTIGKALKFHPSRDEGLVAEVRVSETALGDETLSLADDEVLSASICFAVPGGGQEIRGNVRRIFKAFADHLAFVPDPAYPGAQVLAVRDDTTADAPALETPALDEWAAYLRARRAATAS